MGRISGSLLFDLRRAMYRHLQHVSLSFMDKTEVGRLMSRLQGDVNALQEFLETSIFAVGDFVLLIGIVTVLLALDFELGLLTLSVVLVLILVRIVWLPRAKRAFLRARETSSIVNGALAEKRARRAHHPGDGARVGELRALRREGEGEPPRPPARVEVLQRDDSDRRHPHRHRDGGGDRRRGHHGARQGARARGDGRLPLLRAALLRSHPVSDHPVQHHAAGDGGGTAHLRGAGRAHRGARQAGCDRAAARGARHRARRRDLRLRARPTGAAQHQPAGRAGGDGGPGGTDRIGQDQHHRAGPSLLRRVERSGADRGPRRARRAPGRPRRARRHGAPGALPVHGERSTTTSATTRRTPRARRWRRRRARSGPTTSSGASPRATIRCSISADRTSRSGSASF